MKVSTRLLPISACLATLGGVLVGCQDLHGIDVVVPAELEDAPGDSPDAMPAPGCEIGFEPDGAGCVDIDECVTGQASCHRDARCTNTTGSFTCECNPGFIGDGTTCGLPRSCLELLGAFPDSLDGTYVVDPDGAGILSEPFAAYCDMRGGGWTLVMNQVPGADLPDLQITVNPDGLGTLDQSYRLGNPAITAIVPDRAWKLTDDSNEAFFDPGCRVDWSINYLDMPASICTVGYLTEELGETHNGGHVNVSTRGIGINNSARFCSMRGYNSLAPTSFEAGPAASCLYTRDQTVRLWFR